MDMLNRKISGQEHDLVKMMMMMIMGLRLSLLLLLLQHQPRVSASCCLMFFPPKWSDLVVLAPLPP